MKSAFEIVYDLAMEREQLRKRLREVDAALAAVQKLADRYRPKRKKEKFVAEEPDRAKPEVEEDARRIDLIAKRIKAARPKKKQKLVQCTRCGKMVPEKQRAGHLKMMHGLSLWQSPGAYREVDNDRSRSVDPVGVEKVEIGE